MRCSPELQRRIQSRLNTLAKTINELSELARTEMPGAYIYFEAGGSAHLMEQFERDDNADAVKREKGIVASSPICRFDCGAW